MPSPAVHMRKLHHIGIRIFNFEAANNNKTKRKIKQIFRKSNVPCFWKKKRKKVFPPSHCKVCGKAAIVFLDFSKDIERSRRRWPRKCLLGHVWPGSSTNLGIGLPKWIANLFQNVRPTLSLRPIPIWSEVTCQFSQSRQVQAQVRKFQAFLLPGCKPTSARTRTASTCMYWTAVNSAGFANWGGQTLLMGHQLTLPPNRFFNITTKHVCKAFLQEYRIRDIRFRVLWSKQDPNAKGEDEHERNRKKTGPQRRREKRPRKKYEKITRKKWEKKLDLLKPAFKKKMENQEKPRVFCVFFLRFCCFFFAFFLRFFFGVFCAFFLLFFRVFCVFFCVFLLFFSPLPRGRCFCARCSWRPKSLM